MNKLLEYPEIMRYFNRLRRYRKQNRLKQKHVAHLLGIKNHSLISRWEKGVQLPDLQNAFKLAMIYSVKVDDLFIDLRRSIKLNRATEEIVSLLFD